MSLIDMPLGFHSFLCLLLFLRHVSISSALGIQFVQPPPGSTFPAGKFNAQWQDAGGQQPTMVSLTTYILDLMVGGVSDDDSGVVLQLSTGLVADGSAVSTIPGNAAQTIQNGFYLRMTSNTSTSGNTVINYSNRFSLVEMTGKTDDKYVQGAARSAGTSMVPTAQYNVIQTPVTNATEPNTNASVPSTPTDNVTSKSNRLPTWAIVGVTVGVTIAGTALIIAGAWFLRKRRRTRKLNKDKPHMQPPQRKSLRASFFGGKPELPAHSPTSSVSRSIAEMDIDKDHTELEGTVVVHELEGDWTAYEMPTRHSRQVQAYDPTR